jgi:hypothetical protein
MFPKKSWLNRWYFEMASRVMAATTLTPRLTGEAERNARAGR